MDKATMFDPENRYQNTEALLKDINALKKHTFSIGMFIAIAALCIVSGISGVALWRSVISDIPVETLTEESAPSGMDTEAGEPEPSGTESEVGESDAEDNRIWEFEKNWYRPQ